MARTAKPKKEISMEEALWKSADKLRGSVEPAEYKHVVLSLFFLKFAGDKFDAQREMIAKQYGEKFVDTVNSIIRRKNPPTRLQTLRKQYGYSQRRLAERSGVSLRMIQQYELRAKDINKAAGGTLLALSKVLGCSMEDLFEYDVSEIADE